MSVARATEAFECVKGEDFQINWTIETSDTDTTAVNISGWTFAMKVKRHASDADPSVITPVFTITAASSGQVKAVFAAADTLLMDGDYVFSLWRTDSGSVTCLCAGTFAVIDTTQN